jgi:hypothetical protein
MGTAIRRSLARDYPRETETEKNHFKALKLPTMRAECEKGAGCRARENVHHPGFLLKLSEVEMLERERRAPARPL